MPDLATSIGLVTEVLDGAALVPGVLLLLVAAVLRLAGIRWHSADGVAFDDGRHRGVRWFEHPARVPGRCFPGRTSADVAAGSDVLVYYDARRPDRWQVSAPEPPGRTVLLLGKILTAVGVLSAVVGLLVMVLAGSIQNVESLRLVPSDLHHALVVIRKARAARWWAPTCHVLDAEWPEELRMRWCISTGHDGRDRREGRCGRSGHAL